MSAKAPKPVLTGQRIRTRKRDEKKKFDATAFRDDILDLILEADGDMGEITKAFDNNAERLNYREYGEQLFDILICGGLLAPGGSYVDDGAELSPVSVFECEDTTEAALEVVTLINKLVRRYKYLQNALEEHIKKLIGFIKGFSEEKRGKLVRGLVHMFSLGIVTSKPLTSVLTDGLVKDGTALRFLMMVLENWQNLTPFDVIAKQLSKNGITERMLDFLPTTKRTQKHLEKEFVAHGLNNFVKLYQTRKTAEQLTELRGKVKTLEEEEELSSRMGAEINEFVNKSSLASCVELAMTVFLGIMEGHDWKKTDQQEVQTLRHFKTRARLVKLYMRGGTSEMLLLNSLQEFCYDNMELMKVFHKLVMILYYDDVISEQAVLRWYKVGHSPKGKNQFLKQMEKMVDWLQTAPESEE